VEPKYLDMGMELSPLIESKIPRVIQLIEEEVAAYLGGLQKRPKRTMRRSQGA